MLSIQLLEENDTILPTDWCRPLLLVTMGAGSSDNFSFKAIYGGTPENNVKWVQVNRLFGSCWNGKEVKELNAISTSYEFIRGEVPESHRLNMKNYTDLSIYD